MANTTFAQRAAAAKATATKATATAPVTAAPLATTAPATTAPATTAPATTAPATTAPATTAPATTAPATTASQLAALLGGSAAAMAYGPSGNAVAYAGHVLGYVARNNKSGTSAACYTGYGLGLTVAQAMARGVRAVDIRHDMQPAASNAGLPFTAAMRNGKPGAPYIVLLHPSTPAAAAALAITNAAPGADILADMQLLASHLPAAYAAQVVALAAGHHAPAPYAVPVAAAPAAPLAS